MSTVDQQKIRRTRTGLIAHDPVRAQPGYTLFAPMYGDGTVYLVDMDGKVAHTWRMPYRPGLYGHLLPGGHLFYGGKVMEDLERFEAWPRFKGGGRLGAGWHGPVLWAVTPPGTTPRAQRAPHRTAPPLPPPPPTRGARQPGPGRPARRRGERDDLRRLPGRDADRRCSRVGVAQLGAPRPGDPPADAP